MYQSNKYSGCVKVYKNYFGYFLFLITIKNTGSLSSNDLCMNETGGEICSTNGSLSDDTDFEQTSILSEFDTQVDNLGDGILQEPAGSR